ncbi:hypothetical protein HRI_004299400 [Hibiscus trionum]|uniref:Growth-regulating factor n=1 Tax=Hibiscus trionum TaxID=183268 RepID=A0A9W7J444_HIBTR|nr:hypothetical protein HRI_004299400 [Hibiscus trionum]
MDTRNYTFVSTEKGLGLMMQQVEEYCSNKSFMAMADRHSSSSSSPSSCYGEGFDGGAGGGAPIVCNIKKGLGLESCSNKSFMAMADRHSSSSPSSCYVEGFAGGEGGGGPIVCNTSNQEPCRGDIYDVVGAAAAAAVVLKSLHHHSFSASSGEMAAPVNARVSFTAAQWQELERQAMIFKYIMASVPVPPELLIPITGNSSKIAIKGCLELGFSSNSSDPEPWRCRRTDGKKWRCSRDVAPDQKYCERHSHKSRPRSRKLVELPNHSSNISNKPADGTKQPNQTPHFTTYNNAHLFTSSFDQSRCLEWFMKGETTVPFASNSNTEWQQFKAQGTDYGLNFQAQHLNEQFNPTHSQETRALIDAWSKRHVYSDDQKPPLSSLTLSMSAGDENNQEEDDENNHEIDGFGFMGLATESGKDLRPSAPQMTDTISWMGSSSGGPLAEAMCLGIATTQTASTSSCSKST